MSAIAPALQEYFTQRLISQRQASPHTVAAYRDCFRLLFAYAARTSGKQPAELGFEDLDAGTISGFLTHLEKERGVSVSTRNARLVALRSWFAFAAHRHPEHAALIARVLAIPSKRRDRPLVSFLEPEETDALLNAPGTGRWTGRRDRVLLTFAVQTGLRVSELTAVRNADIALGRGAHVQVLGKGRKERAVPLVQPHRRGPAPMAQRTSRRSPRTGLPRPWRASPQPRHSAKARHQARALGSSGLPLARCQENRRSYPSPHLRDDPAAQRG